MSIQLVKFYYSPGLSFAAFLTLLMKAKKNPDIALTLAATVQRLVTSLHFFFCITYTQDLLRISGHAPFIPAPHTRSKGDAIVNW